MLQTVIVDSKGFVWIGGTQAQDSILKFTRDGKFVWDFGHRPPPEAGMMPENNQETSYLVNKGRFQLDEVADELYIIQQKRVLVYDASTGAFKRGWGGHGMPLSEMVTEPDLLTPWELQAGGRLLSHLARATGQVRRRGPFGGLQRLPPAFPAKAFR